MTKIQSKIYQPNENEGTWPSQRPSGDKGFFWIDSDGNLTEEPPELCHNVFGEAPYVIQDSITPYYHPRLEKYVDSRSKLEMVDKALGTITMGTNEAPSITTNQIRKRIRDELREDRKIAREKAIAKLDAGMAPLDEKKKAVCKDRNERLAHQLGMESFKHNGRKYKLK